MGETNKENRAESKELSVEDLKMFAEAGLNVAKAMEDTIAEMKKKWQIDLDKKYEASSGYDKAMWAEEKSWMENYSAQLDINKMALKRDLLLLEQDKVEYPNGEKVSDGLKKITAGAYYAPMEIKPWLDFKTQAKK